MRDEDKTRDQLIAEVKQLYQELVRNPQAVPSPGREEKADAGHISYDSPSDPSEIKSTFFTDNPTLNLAFVDRNLRYLYVNSNYALLMGKSIEAFTDTYVKDILPPAVYETATPYCKRALAGETVGFEVQVVYDQPHLMDVSFVPLEVKGNVIGFYAIVSDFSIRKKTEQLLSSLASIVQSSIDAIIGIDSSGKIFEWNKSSERLFGYTSEEMLGNSIMTLVPEIPVDEAIATLDVAGGQPVRLETRCRRKDGSELDAMISLLPIFSDGEVVGRAAIVRDITVRKKQEHELDLAREALERYAAELELSNKYKSEFLATMSHEIRTPMNGVLGMIGSLMKTDLNNNQMKKANMALNSAKSLLIIINDILDFSKVDAGKMELEILDFDLRTLLDDLGESMALKAQEKDLEIIVNVIDVDQSMVRGDPSRILQILTNLLGNAVKFTRSGEVIIKASIGAGKAQKLSLTCSIQDTGIGIAEEKQGHMFEPFRQVDASTTRNFGGTGLGLAIVKRLCELMDGKIDVSTPSGGGSCFEFTVGLQRSDLSHEVTPQVHMDELNILVVEGNVTTRTVLCDQFAKWGAKVQGFSSGEAALMALQRGKNSCAKQFDIAFVNSDLPDMEAVQFSKRVNSSSDFEALKLVIMTSMDHGGDAKHYADLGFSANFPKPATTSDLLNALNVVAREEWLATQTPNLAHHYITSLDADHSGIMPTTNYDHVDVESNWSSETRLLLVEDNLINQEVTINLLEDFGLSADIASNGQEALEALIISYGDIPYSLILMDCQMPVMDGYSATNNIRSGAASEQYKGIPIIALTANAMVGDRQKCLDEGMSDYLSKPIEPDELVLVLKKWISLKRLDEAHPRP